VWVVYALGLLAASIIVLSLLFTSGAFLLSDDVPVTYDVSPLAIVLWGALVLLAGVTWLTRRRRR
jgi:LPXTG-motif cell wall-anchored protein